MAEVDDEWEDVQQRPSTLVSPTTTEPFSDGLSRKGSLTKTPLNSSFEMKVNKEEGNEEPHHPEPPAEVQRLLQLVNDSPDFGDLLFQRSQEMESLNLSEDSPQFEMVRTVETRRTAPMAAAYREEYAQMPAFGTMGDFLANDVEAIKEVRSLSFRVQIPFFCKVFFSLSRLKPLRATRTVARERMTRRRSPCRTIITIPQI